MTEKLTLLEMTSVEAAERFKKTQTAVVAVGSIEHHGPHLPLSTDYLWSYQISRLIARKTGVVVTPVIPVGLSHYLMPWSGTLTVSVETYAKYLEEITMCLVQHGAKNFVYLCCHGGNRVGMEVAAMNVQMKSDAQILIFLLPSAMLRLFGEVGGHAGSLETAAVLAYDPGLVDKSKAVHAKGEPPDEAAKERIDRMRGRIRPDFYKMVQDWKKEVSPDGWMGDVQSATAADGKKYVERLADEVIDQMNVWFGRDYRKKK